MQLFTINITVPNLYKYKKMGRKRIKILLEREVILKALDVHIVLQSLVEVVMPLLQKKKLDIGHQKLELI